MTNNLNRRDAMLCLTAMLSLAAAPLPLSAEEATVIEMLNKDPDNKKRTMVFKPLLQVIDPGQTVRFAAIDKGHNSASIDGMIPKGATPWKSKTNKQIEVTLDIPGFYGYRCVPHYAMGMVGLIVVRGDGMLNNLEAAKKVKQRGRAKAIFKEIWKLADEEGLTKA